MGCPWYAGPQAGAGVVKMKPLERKAYGLALILDGLDPVQAGGLREAAARAYGLARDPHTTPTDDELKAAYLDLQEAVDLAVESIEAA